MPKKTTTQTATNLTWRTFNPQEQTTDQEGTTTLHRHIKTYKILGPCHIIQKTDPKAKKTFQRIELTNLDQPNTPTYLAIHTTENLGRQLIYIITPEHDKYLLALPRNNNTITITDEPTLYTQSRDWETHLDTTKISTHDQQTLQQAANQWTKQQ